MKKFIWIILVAILILVVWFFWGSIFSKSSDTAAKKTGAKTPGKTAVNGTQSFPIRYGDKGNTVRQMQEMLNGRYGQHLVIDGIYGNHTKQSLLDNGFPIDVDYASFLTIIGSNAAQQAMNNIAL